jgi:PAS domain S-box-containing protein
MAIKETAPELKMESQALNRALAEKEEAMAAMRESEETLRSVMQADPDIVIVADPEGKIKFINHTVAEHSPGKIVGTSVYDYVAEGFHGVLEESFKTVMRTGKTGSYEISGPGLKGTARRYETRVVPITRKGKVTELILIARDIGAEKGAGSERKG